MACRLLRAVVPRCLLFALGLLVAKEPNVHILYENPFKVCKTPNILYNNKTDNLDSLKFHFGPYVHYKMNSEYISLKSSGKLNLISNSKLRSKLVNFYEVYYSIYKELEEEHKFFIDKRVNDYFFNQFPSDTSNFVDSKFVKSKLNDQTFKKILDQQITSLQYITENFYIEKIDELIKIITEELKNKQ